MIDVQYPQPQFRIRSEQGKKFIFDPLRRSWLLLTEEEWVRQNFVAYLSSVLSYPTAFIAVEKEIWLHELKKRFDILVYDSKHQPWLMVECKASSVMLGEDVLQQVLRYNISLPVQYLVITNGSSTLAWKKEGGELVEIGELPAWS